jgi:hypothetical protein
MRTRTTTTGAVVAVAVAVAVNDGDLFNNGMLIFILTFYPLFPPVIYRRGQEKKIERKEKREGGREESAKR